MTSLFNSAAQIVHQAAASLTAAAPIEVGHELPSAEVKENAPTEKITLNNKPGKILIVGVPAAFSPSCSNQVPGYIASYEKFKERGVSEIYVVSVNDYFAMKAWKDKLAPEGTPIHFIADDKAAFTAALGLMFDATPLLGGPRAMRYVLIVEDGKVTHSAVEQSPPDVTVTAAEKILALFN